MKTTRKVKASVGWVGLTLLAAALASPGCVDEPAFAADEDVVVVTDAPGEDADRPSNGDGGLRDGTEADSQPQPTDVGEDTPAADSGGPVSDGGPPAAQDTVSDSAPEDSSDDVPPSSETVGADSSTGDAQQGPPCAEDRDCDSWLVERPECTRVFCSPEPMGRCVAERAEGGSECDDGNACTTDDCDDHGGRCVGGPPPACDDGLACNGREICDRVAGCVSGTPVSCSDGDACNGLETCSEPAGECASGHPVVCDDGNPCDGVEKCDRATGDCLEGTPLSAADCTLLGEHEGKVYFALASGDWWGCYSRCRDSAPEANALTLHSVEERWGLSVMMTQAGILQGWTAAHSTCEDPEAYDCQGCQALAVEYAWYPRNVDSSVLHTDYSNETFSDRVLIDLWCSGWPNCDAGGEPAVGITLEAAASDGVTACLWNESLSNSNPCFCEAHRP